ncbi:hypothetical protein Plhal710r2_c016g0072611 [Plasmopara halstedii]
MMLKTLVLIQNRLPKTMCENECSQASTSTKTLLHYIQLTISSIMSVLASGILSRF